MLKLSLINKIYRAQSRISRQLGFSMIEVLIALALGMLITSAALGILMASRKTSGITQALGQLQENERLAFALLAADLRRAGDYPCAGFTKRTDNDGNDPLVYLIKAPHPNLNHHRDGIYGSITNNMDSLELYLDNASGASGYAQFAEVAGYQYELRNHQGRGYGSRAKNGIKSGVLVLCNADVAMVYDLDSNNHCGGDLISRKAPDYANCAAKDMSRLRYCFWPANFNHQPHVINHPDQFHFKYNADCDEMGRSAAFVLETQRMKVDWYVAENGRGDFSLYRRYPAATGYSDYNLEEKTEEIIAGIQAMQLRYHVNGQNTYKPAHEITDTQWRDVDTVHIKITFQPSITNGLGETDKQGTDGQALTRDMEAYIAIRNHIPYVI